MKKFTIPMACITAAASAAAIIIGIILNKRKI